MNDSNSTGNLSHQSKIKSNLTLSDSTSNTTATNNNNNNTNNDQEASYSCNPNTCNLSLLSNVAMETPLSSSSSQSSARQLIKSEFSKRNQLKQNFSPKRKLISAILNSNSNASSSNNSSNNNGNGSETESISSNDHINTIVNNNNQITNTNCCSNDLNMEEISQKNNKKQRVSYIHIKAF